MIYIMRILIMPTKSRLTYSFGASRAEGHAKMREVLGGKWWAGSFTAGILAVLLCWAVRGDRIGAALSPGGKPIIALPATTSKGESRIVPQLKPGAGVVTTRAHVQYVVTEYGIVNLHGKNLRQRAEAMATIASAGQGVIVLLNCSQTDDALESQLSDRADKATRRSDRSADLRTYGIGAQILRDLGVGRMRLMAAPRKMPSMTGFDLEITGYLTKTP